jgi:hypothetical protein
MSKIHQLQLEKIMDELTTWLHNLNGNRLTPSALARIKGLENLLHELVTDGPFENLTDGTMPSSPYPVNALAEEWLACSGCSIHVKTKHLFRHQKKCPGMRIESVSLDDVRQNRAEYKTIEYKAGKTRKKVAKTSSPPALHNGNDERARERKLDASRDDHRMLDDRGRYFSSSSYDDYGEESGA